MRCKPNNTNTGEWVDIRRGYLGYDNVLKVLKEKTNSLDINVLPSEKD